MDAGLIVGAFFGGIFFLAMVVIAVPLVKTCQHSRAGVMPASSLNRTGE